MKTPPLDADHRPPTVTECHTVTADEADRFRALLDRVVGDGARWRATVQADSTVPLGLVAAVALRATGSLFDEVDGPASGRGTVALHGAQTLRLLRSVRCGEELVSSAAVRSVRTLVTGTVTEAIVVISVDGAPVAEAVSLLVHSALTKESSILVSSARGRGAVPVTDGAGCTSVFSVTHRLVREYAEVSGDHNPVHLSRTAARKAGFPDTIAHGMLTFALVGHHLDEVAGDGAVSELRLRFTRPLVVGIGSTTALRVTERPAACSDP